jgi:tetratricopeptide (TPR) repeat protein
MGKLLLLFLSCLFVLLLACGQPTHSKRSADCSDKHIQDSLIQKYIDSGAKKLPGAYNNPAWQSYFDSLIAMCPDIAAAYQLKALPYIKNGEYEKAFALNDMAVQLAPEKYTDYRAFLKCIFTKDYEGALVDFQKAEQLIPNGIIMDHTYSFYAGLCNLELGNYERAAQNFKQDIFIQTGGDPGNSIHFNTLLYVGILYYEMKNNGLAKEYLLRCLQAYSKLPEANYYLALVYEREGNETLKRKYLEMAKQAYDQGYRMNEDNLYYANYPHEIKGYEMDEALKGVR